MGDSMRKPTLLLCSAFALGFAFAGAVFAADPRLDDALANLEKAEALLRAAEVPPRAKDNVREAIDHVKAAKREVERARNQSN
jgi:hypothetical protein